MLKINPYGNRQLDSFTAVGSKRPGKSTAREDSPASSPGTPLQAALMNSPKPSRKRRRTGSESAEQSGSEDGTDKRKEQGSKADNDDEPMASSSEDDEPLAKMAKINHVNGIASSRSVPGPGQGGRSLAGKGAGKGKGKQREPISVVRKEGDDMVVDDEGKPIHKAGLSVGHAEDEALVKKSAEKEMPLKAQEVAAKQVEEAADVVNRLTQGVTVDVDQEMRTTGLAEDVDVEEIEDWGDLDVVSGCSLQACMTFCPTDKPCRTHYLLNLPPRSSSKTSSACRWSRRSSRRQCPRSSSLASKTSFRNSSPKCPGNTSPG